MDDGPGLGAPGSGPTLQDMREARGHRAPTASRYAIPAPVPVPRGPLPPSVRFKAVDGLRGVAIASVLLYHTDWFQNGLFGVDVFFVLSGFLVSLVLIRELDRTDGIRLGVFYRRRAKRLLPGLFATIILVVGLSALVSPLRDVKDLRPQALATLAQIANWAQLDRGDAYWQHFASIDPLAAMWSLSITEQFYALWPLLLLMVFGLCRRSLRATGIVTAVLFAAFAAVAPLMWNGDNSDRLYLGTETRAVGFAAGATAAFGVYLWLRGRVRAEAASGADGARTGHGLPGGAALPTLVGTAALGGLVWASLSVGSYHEPWLYQGGLAVVAALAAVLTASLCFDRGPLVWLLSLPPVRLTGTISYSLYLLHLPVYWLLQHYVDDISPQKLLLIGGPVSWVLAWLLHTGTEKLRVLRWRAFPAVPLLAVTAAVATTGAWYLPAWVTHDMKSGPNNEPVVLVLGDSFAQDLATGLYRHGDRYRVVDGGISGCGVFDPDKVRTTSGTEFETSPDCRDRATEWDRSLASAAPKAVVIHLGWDAAEQYLDGTWLNPCDDDYRSRYRTQLTQAVEQVRRRAPGAQVLLMNERVENGAISKAWGGCYNQQVGDFVKSAGGTVRLADLDTFYCPYDTCVWKDKDGHWVTPVNDGVHLTPAGMRFVTPWLEKEIAGALSGAQPDQPAGPAPAPRPTATPTPTPTPAATAAPSPTATTRPTGRPATSKPGRTPTGRATSGAGEHPAGPQQ